VQHAVESGCSGPYVQAHEGLDRAKELSREELRKLLDSANEAANLDNDSSANGSLTDE